MKRFLTGLLGVALAAGVAIGLYYAWREVPWAIRQIPGGPWRTMANDFRLLLEILGAFLVISTIDWLWRKTVGEPSDDG